MKNIISSSDIITIKIGSSLLIKNNKFNSRWLSSLISDIEFFQKKKKKSLSLHQVQLLLEEII